MGRSHRLGDFVNSNSRLRSQGQNERMREERMEQIRQEALRQFATKGLFATKIKDIADALGIAQGLIYHYYQSKEDIYVELIGNALDKMNSGVSMLQAMDLRPHEKIRAAIEQFFYTIETSEDYIQTSRLIAQAANSVAIPEEARALIEEKRDMPYQAMAKIMVEGQREGTIIDGDPNELAIMFWASVSGLAVYKATRTNVQKIPDAQLLIRLSLK